jgi:hypothetical protein
MRAKIVAFLLSGALLAGAHGAAATAGGATVVWQNPKMRVTESLQPLTITFKNKIARPIRFRCRVPARQLLEHRTWQAQAAGEEDHPAGQRDDGQSVFVPDQTPGIASR